MEISQADYGIAGEAEDIFPLLLERIENGEDTGDIPNLISAGTRSVQKGLAGARKSLSRYRFSEIDRHIDFKPYRSRGVYSIQTKRGCGHGCIYCTYPLIEGRSFRVRPPSEIADEIEQANRRLGNVTFEFVDSTFNDPAGHAEDICRELVRRKLKVRMRTMGINPGHSSSRLFGLMKDAGFTQIDATPDSASPVMLKSLRKGFTRKEVEKMAILIRQFDLPTMWFFLFGGPGETSETFAETIDFIDNYINPADLVYMASGLRIYPGTPLYRTALSEGRIRPGQSILRPPVYYYPDSFPKERLDKLIREATMTRPNCIPPLESTPTPEMLRETNEMRISQNLTEPMFRSLLRIRKKWRLEGKI